MILIKFIMTKYFWRETKKKQIKLATTCNGDEQQQDAKNNAEFWTKWAKTTWKTLEENIRLGRKGSIKRIMMMMMMV
jgi:hypothetical protein